MDMMNKRKEQLTLPNIAIFATRVRFTTKKLQSAHETRILTKILKAERTRKKIIKNCYFHAEWAGTDLQRWDRVFAEYEKSPKKLKILDSLKDEAHSQFLTIMVETENMGEIEKRCAGNPFLTREFTILQNEMENYHTEYIEEYEEDPTSNDCGHDIDFKM